MCGISGFVARQGWEDAVSSCSRSLEAMRYRGPDHCGEFQDGHVWLGHLRLSILDLSSAANQPMVSTDGRFVICYNGEVYNFAELAQSLDIYGMRSHSDTEVLLNAFQRIGVDVVSQFNGMFAFAIYDRLKQTPAHRGDSRVV